MTALEWLKKLADEGLINLREDGSAAAGHNGPYLNPETAVRNTGHWLIIFARLYKWTDDPKFLNGVKSCAEFLTSSDARPHNFTFFHRNTPGKDSCNGLVGQAWSIQTLVEAWQVLGDDRYMKLATEVFELHAFDDSTALWYCREVNGDQLGVDMTFNHQLWFAAAAALLPDEKAQARVNRFLDRMDDNLRLYPNGLIQHRVAALACWHVDQDNLIKSAVRFVRDSIREKINQTLGPISQNNKMYQKCIGYHSFNTYAFALLKTIVPQHSFSSSRKIEKALGYLCSSNYETAIDAEQTYGYGYNPPGFEVPFSIYGLSNESDTKLAEITSHWLGKQLEKTWTKDKGYPASHVADPATAIARAYELALMPRSILEAANL